MYRLMQISETTIPIAAKYTHLFSRRRKRNRIEFMSDFPRGDEAEVISSLQVNLFNFWIIYFSKFLLYFPSTFT